MVTLINVLFLLTFATVSQKMEVQAIEAEAEARQLEIELEIEKLEALEGARELQALPEIEDAGE